MKIVGIVAEFNPFHNGHQYIIDYAKNNLQADYIIIAMSGDYVQRGEPSIFDKYVRASCAILAGADAVFSLPVQISVASASYYALGAVSLLSKLGCTHILFGSEAGNIEALANSCFELGKIDSPNNILGREYINSISKLNLNIKAVTIKRINSNYNDADSVINGFCSASYIRKNIELIFNNQFQPQIMPQKIFNIYNEYLAHNCPVFLNDYSSILISRLLMEAHKGYNQYFDVFNDFSSKIANNIYKFNNFETFIDLLKSKDIARSHISRALMNICLGITKEQFSILKSYDYAIYGRVISFNKSSDILSVLSKESQIPIISKLSEFVKSAPADMASILNTDLNASHLYSYFANKKTASIINECSRKI